jgi:chorismate mutase / prephenate dehydratase
MSDPVPTPNVVSIPGMGTSASISPGELRMQLDQLDHELAGLVVRRMELAAQASRGEVNAGLPLRPAWDVTHMRRLKNNVPRHTEAVHDVWRALEGAAAREQSAFVVSACSPTDPLRMAELARRHFGPAINLKVDSDARVALTTAVQSSEPTVLVLPWPGPGGGGGWWTMLRERVFADVRIVAALPLLEDGRDPEACVVAVGVPVEPAGEDIALILCDDDSGDAERRLRDVGFAAVPVVKARHQTLFRVHGFVAPDDPRISAIARSARSSLDVVRLVGTYARV